VDNVVAALVGCIPKGDAINTNIKIKTKTIFTQ
jgi:hypothetical protein